MDDGAASGCEIFFLEGGGLDDKVAEELPCSRQFCLLTELSLCSHSFLSLFMFACAMVQLCMR